MKEATGPASQIERKPIGDLTPYARNARTHSPEQINKIAASIVEWGWTNPILIDETGMIIAGHGRLRAAEKLGITEIPCVVAKGWTKAQVRAYVIADNQLALDSGWDQDLLQVELADLNDLDFDMGLVGFDVGELADSMGLGEETEKTETEETPTPEVEDRVVAERGQVWEMGRHRVLCGDSINAKDLPMSDVDAILTDPPYSSGSYQEGRASSSSSIGRRSEHGHQIDRDNLTAAGASALLQSAFGNAIDAVEVFAFTDWRMFGHFSAAVEACGFPVRAMIVWDKCSIGMGAPWRNQHEIVVYGRRIPATTGKCGNVIRIPRQKSELHPTQKPVELIVELMKNSESKCFFDPFLGSGTTLIAAEQLGRTCYGCEISPQYVDVIIRRWQSLTGEAATLAGTDETFADHENRTDKPDHS